MYRSILFALTLISCSTIARAGDSTLIAPETTSSIVGTSADGSAYAIVFVGRNELESERNVCAYPAWPGLAPAGVDELAVEVRRVRQPERKMLLLDWGANHEQGKLDPSRCTSKQTQASRRQEVDKLLADAGITVPPTPLPALAVTPTREIVIPAAAMRTVKIDADVFLTVATRPDGRAWISVRADGYGDERVQTIKAGLSVDGATATLLPGQPYIVVVPFNFRGWNYATVELPLARLAVRLLTARGERTGAVADLDAALALDPTFERAKKARAR